LEKKEARKKKQRTKKLRHKWKMLISKNSGNKKVNKLKRAKKKIWLIDKWNEFENVKMSIGKIIKERITDWCNRMTKRKNLLNDFLTSCAIKTRKKLDEKMLMLERNYLLKL
jgi:hypothetical protein